MFINVEIHTYSSLKNKQTQKNGNFFSECIEILFNHQCYFQSISKIKICIMFLKPLFQLNFLPTGIFIYNRIFQQPLIRIKVVFPTIQSNLTLNIPKCSVIIKGQQKDMSQLYILGRNIIDNPLGKRCPFQTGKHISALRENFHAVLVVCLLFDSQLPVVKKKKKKITPEDRLDFCPFPELLKLVELVVTVTIKTALTTLPKRRGI